MRIRSINIREWRLFSNVSLHLEDLASLVCIVGPNGSGKSQLLELIGVCAYRLGLSAGLEIHRGDPFVDRHDFDIQFHLAPGISNAVDNDLSSHPLFSQWDRTVKIESSNLDSVRPPTISAGGITDTRESIQFAARVTQALQSSKDVHFLSLDADRAYPKKAYPTHEMAQAYEQDWSTSQLMRASSFRRTATLYDEWIKYCIAKENQLGARLMQNHRKSKISGAVTPVFEDHFEPYAASLRKVLSHLIFTGPDSKRKTLLFNTTGLELSFDQLSGGEREIAFLLGQIDRFQLRRGLFLIDEPELHLNSDLIRSWVAYLVQTISIGQVWLATHSLEAVEAAGPKTTFVLERNEQTRKVDSVARLDKLPVLSALSRAVGTPAFSLSLLSFVFVEGQEAMGEREKFRRLADPSKEVRFMEGGSCTEVIRRVSWIKALAKESGSEIRVGGVVDRDFRSSVEIEQLEKDYGIFVLPVHEIENLFLHPETISALLEQNGRNKDDSLRAIQDSSDNRAGVWIFQHAMATKNSKSLPKVSLKAKEFLTTTSWDQFASDSTQILDSISASTGFESADQEKFRQILEISVDTYREKRTDPELWKNCEGKQVLNEIARRCGFSDASSFRLAAFALWDKDSNFVPNELLSLRSYISSL